MDAPPADAPDDGPDPVLPDDPALARWLAELRTEDSARSRSRVGALQAIAAESATLVGVLSDLCERGGPVVLGVVGGRRHRGRVLLVGPDAVVLAVGQREWLVTRLAAVTSVRLVGGDPVHGEGMATTTSRFGRILAAAAPPGDWMRVSVGGEALGGTVVAVSEEVAVLRLDNGDLTYVNLAAADEVSLTGVG